MWTKGLLSFKNLAKTRNACCEQNIEYNCVVYLFNMLQACYYQKYCAAGISYFSVDTEGKLNVQKTFRRRPGRPLNVLCTLNLRPVAAGMVCYQRLLFNIISRQKRF